MNIQEATKKALAENKCITIPHNGEIVFMIEPTNGDYNCKFYFGDGTPASINPRALSHGWQPSANDLISDEWILVDHNKDFISLINE